jgi:hypothetical protein
MASARGECKPGRRRCMPQLASSPLYWVRNRQSGWTLGRSRRDGARILRVFTNTDPENRLRYWRTGHSFERVAARYLPHIEPPCRARLSSCGGSESRAAYAAHISLHAASARYCQADTQYQQTSPWHEIASLPSVGGRLHRPGAPCATRWPQRAGTDLQSPGACSASFGAGADQRPPSVWLGGELAAPRSSPAGPSRIDLAIGCEPSAGIFARRREKQGRSILREELAALSHPSAGLDRPRYGRTLSRQPARGSELSRAPGRVILLPGSARGADRKPRER